MATRRKWWLITSFTLLALVVVLVVRFVWFPGIAFDPDAWEEDSRGRRGVRLEMADRLIAHGTLIGKSRAEVIEMLGEPTSTDGANLEYYLGPERSIFPIDSERLVLRLAEDGRVVANRIARD